MRGRRALQRMRRPPSGRQGPGSHPAAITPSVAGGAPPRASTHPLAHHFGLELPAELLAVPRQQLLLHNGVVPLGVLGQVVKGWETVCAR